jgi:DNA-binding beta-propeller fold protein YncE
MKKLIIGLAIMLSIIAPANATKVPENVRNFVTADYPEAVFRFDGVVILPDNTVYLPLIPSKFNTEDEVNIKYTLPAGKKLSDKPDAIVLSNDYVMLKLLTNANGKNTVINLPAPPVELVTGLFPQDMLVPKNFAIPNSMKNIIGNLDIRTMQSNGMILPVIPPKAGLIKNSISNIPALKDKIFYIASRTSKNIQVVNPENNYASYALSQEEMPITVKGYDVFLLVTSYGKKSMDVISLTDDKVIKEVNFATQPEEIVIDNKNKLAYISSGGDASLYVVDLETMTVKKQIRLNGMCEKVIISEDGTKLFYNDKQTREVWAIELDNDYLLKKVGRFANVSKLAFIDGKLYVTSRTNNYLAIVDYDSQSLLSGNAISAKPVDMLAYKDQLFVLGAAEKTIDVIDTSIDKRTDIISLPDSIFPTKIVRIDDTNIAIVTDAKSNTYSVLDLDKKEVIKTNRLDIPVSAVYVTKNIKKIGSK